MSRQTLPRDRQQHLSLQRGRCRAQNDLVDQGAEVWCLGALCLGHYSLGCRTPPWSSAHWLHSCQWRLPGGESLDVAGLGAWIGRRRRAGQRRIWSARSPECYSHQSCSTQASLCTSLPPCWGLASDSSQRVLLTALVPLGLGQIRRLGGQQCSHFAPWIVRNRC